MLHTKETVRPLAIAALVIGLAGCGNGGADAYHVECGTDYCSWFVGTQLVAVADINSDGYRNLSMTDPWPGP